MRIIVDTNLWINHLRGRNSDLRGILREEDVLIHPLIYGELALGTYAQRDMILEYLRELPSAVVATNNEVYQTIERHSIYGRGIGIADTMILCSTLITPKARLWTLDTRLAKIADELGVAYRHG